MFKDLIQIVNTSVFFFSECSFPFQKYVQCVYKQTCLCLLVFGTEQLFLIFHEKLKLPTF